MQRNSYHKESFEHTGINLSGFCSCCFLCQSIWKKKSCFLKSHFLNGWCGWPYSNEFSCHLNFSVVSYLFVLFPIFYIRTPILEFVSYPILPEIIYILTSWWYWFFSPFELYQWKSTDIKLRILNFRKLKKEKQQNYPFIFIPQRKCLVIFFYCVILVSLKQFFVHLL